jgi:hypothetical protein
VPHVGLEHLGEHLGDAVVEEAEGLIGLLARQRLHGELGLLLAPLVLGGLVTPKIPSLKKNASDN